MAGDLEQVGRDRAELAPEQEQLVIRLEPGICGTVDKVSAPHQSQTAYAKAIEEIQVMDQYGIFYTMVGNQFNGTDARTYIFLPAGYDGNVPGNFVTTDVIQVGDTMPHFTSVNDQGNQPVSVPNPTAMMIASGIEIYHGQFIEISRKVCFCFMYI